MLWRLVAAGRLSGAAGRLSGAAGSLTASEALSGIRTRFFRSTRRKTPDVGGGGNPLSREGGAGGQGQSPALVEGASSLPPVGFGALVRPAIFCGAFTAASFAGAAVWQYENMRKAAQENSWFRRPDGGFFYGAFGGQQQQQQQGGEKAFAWRQELSRLWREASPGAKVFVPFCLANVAVWMAWRAPSLGPVMLRWFACNPAGRSTCIPMLTSAFSHYSFLHLAVNMYVLHSFAVPMVSVLGKEQFTAVYLSSAVFSSLLSSAYKVATGRCGYSLGASGAILALIGVFGSVMPEARLQIVFLPMFSFTAASALKGLALMDALGMALRWRFFDHAAHLSGLVFGVAYVKYGNELVWNRHRESVMRWWHENVRERRANGDGRGGGA